MDDGLATSTASLPPTLLHHKEPLSPLRAVESQQQQQPNGIVIILEDINERKVMEQKLKKYKTRLRLLETKMVRVRRAGGGGRVRGEG